MDLKKAKADFAQQAVVSLSTQSDTEAQVMTDMDDLERSSNQLMT